ncbi:MAG: hypothetical protein IJ379_05320 [Lachnospiraceae bacterium]|nr:hypothetical protein [Lachnospiraceae bacterium]
MNCPYCGKEMKNGIVQTGDLLSSITKVGEIVTFIQEGEEKKLLPKQTISLAANANEAYYCAHCAKVVAIFEELGAGFWQ